MTLPIERIVARVEALIERSAERDERAGKVLAVRQGRIAEIYPDFFPEDMDSAVVANFIDIVARDLSEVMAPLPAVNCSSASQSDAKSRAFADTRTQIASNYFIHSDLNVNMYTAADRYVTYGFTAFVVELDDEAKLPRIRVEDSYQAYPEFDRYNRCIAFAKKYVMTVGELVNQFPEHEAAILGKRGYKQNLNAQIDIIRYYDKDQSVIYAPNRSNLVLSTAVNPIGEIMVKIARRPGVDNTMRGQFDDVLGVQLLRNRFATLAIDAAEKAVLAPIVVPQDTQDMQFGPDAIIRTNNPQGVRRVSLELPASAFTEQQLLNQEMQLGARYPQGRTGNINASVITGQGVQALMGAFDTQVKSFQAIMASTLRDVIRICFKVDEKVYNVKKTIRGVDAGSPFAIEYIPEKDIDGDYSAEVRYGMLAGLNPAQGLVFILQAIQAKLVSKDMGMRELPFNVNVTQEQEKIEIEDMRSSLLLALEATTQAIPQMIAQGADPSAIISKIAQAIKDRANGKVLEDSLSEIFAPPPAPEPTTAPETPGQPAPPEGMPGMPEGQPGQESMAGAAPPDIQTILSRLTSSGAAQMSARTSTSRQV